MRTQSSNARVWFLSPVAISLVIAAIAMIPTALIDDQHFRTIWKTPKSITQETLWIFACGAMALAFGALMAMSMRPEQQRSGLWPNLNGASIRLLRKSSTVLTALTAVGYLGFAFLFLRSGLSVSEVLSPSYNSGISIRDAIGTIPGLTTLTQCGMAAVVLSSTVLAQQFYRRELIYVGAVLLLAIPRAYFFSERLAILEITVPIVVILCARLAASGGTKRMVAQSAPLVGVPFVIILFSIFEYFRSWSFYRSRTNSGFVPFALERLAGYYTTSLNNGQLILSHLNWPGRWPFDTIEGFWTAPGISQIPLYDMFTGHPMPYSNKAKITPMSEVLTQFGNPEFNNPSGYVGPFIDYGVYGGLAFFFAFGILAGLLYKGFCDGKPYGLLLYPIIFVGLLELPRYMHWAQGRTIYTWIALIAVAVLLTKTQQDQPPEEIEPPAKSVGTADRQSSLS